ncbi:MAG: DUF5318 family protein [Acidimicrobiales bacterium]
MSFGPEAIRGVPPSMAGTIDYRLARQAVVREYRRKRLARHEVCDAHPELLRAARSSGQPTEIDCPICEAAQVVLVSYVFGPGLPRSGRCVTTMSEMAELNRRRAELACYVVEVCPDCAWNHLTRVFPVGGRRASQDQARS